MKYYLGSALNYLNVDNNGTIVKKSFKQFENGKIYDLVIEAKDTKGRIVSLKKIYFYLKNFKCKFIILKFVKNKVYIFLKIILNVYNYIELTNINF